MPAKKKTAAKRSRSPDGVNDALAPVKWDHTPADVSAWKRDDSLLYLDLHSTDSLIKKCEQLSNQVKIAGFDMDDTIVMSREGKVFSKGRADWKFLDASVGPKLQSLHTEGYRVVFFTNQSGIGGKAWDESKANEIRGKIIDIGNALSIPISAWISAKEDKYRKPGLGMWEHFVATLPFPVDYSKSFYCGDAAGRKILTMAARKKDFSCSDRKFAINAGLTFHTPEEYFLGHPKNDKEEIDWDGVSPAELSSIPKAYPLTSYHNTPAALLKPFEVVIFVGFPGCGKSTFFRRFFAPYNYFHVNRDTLKDAAKCIAAAGTALAKGQSVVIDNTNPGKDDRKPYVELAKKHGAGLRAIHFTASKEMAFHMNVMRDRIGISARVSSIAYNIFKGKFHAPEEQEGFSEVLNVPPVADFTGLPAAAKEQFFKLT